MILENYPRGIFPMGSSDYGVVTWHCPSRRAVIPLDGFHVSRSLSRTLKQGRFEVTVNRAFGSVVDACADRPDCPDTWITGAIKRAYAELHRRGHAHSLEIWVDGSLAGGVYGVHLAGAFFAESKFHRVRDMSKVALAHLASRLRERRFGLLEVQYLTPHLRQFGAVEISHSEYVRRLTAALQLRCRFD